MRSTSFKSVSTHIPAGVMVRVHAANCVLGIIKGKSLNNTLPKALSELSALDKGLLQEIVYGTLRHRRLLDNTLKDFLKENVKGAFFLPYTLLLCAFYQLTMMRVPDHACVDVTVEACRFLKCRNYCNAVNAILRNFIREGKQLKDSDNPAIRYSMPDWLYNKIHEEYPREYQSILENSNNKAPLFIRVENSKIGTTEYQKILEKQGIVSKSYADMPSTLLIEKALTVDKLPFFKEGLVSVQDFSAQYASTLLKLEDGQRVLDTCAAPGGKSAHILDLANVSLTSCEIDMARMTTMQENFKRLGRSPQCLCLDASQGLTSIEGEFDRVLVDAPCSGTGVIRRHPDIKWLRRQKDIATLVATQSRILDHALTKVKKGGILLYTTCSILHEENTLQVEQFLERHHTVHLYPFSHKGQVCGYYQRLPGEDGGDGFFYARFIKD